MQTEDELFSALRANIEAAFIRLSNSQPLRPLKRYRHIPSFLDGLWQKHRDVYHGAIEALKEISAYSGYDYPEEDTNFTTRYARFVNEEKERWGGLETMADLSIIECGDLIVLAPRAFKACEDMVLLVSEGYSVLEAKTDVCKKAVLLFVPFSEEEKKRGLAGEAGTYARVDSTSRAEELGQIRAALHELGHILLFQSIVYQEHYSLLGKIQMKTPHKKKVLNWAHGFQEGYLEAEIDSMLGICPHIYFLLYWLLEEKTRDKSAAPSEKKLASLCRQNRAHLARNHYERKSSLFFFLARRTEKNYFDALVESIQALKEKLDIGKALEAISRMKWDEIPEAWAKEVIKEYL